MAYIGRDVDKISNVEVLDNITFDGSSSYTLQKNSVNFTPSSANTLLISIDGVVQAGNFTVSGSTIDFGTAVAGTSTCDFILHYGIGLITTVSDGTVTTAKIADGAITSAKINSSVGLGITEADQWRLTANISSDGTSQFITSNLERIDTSGQGTLGTGMTESSGVFTFPSTGIWLVRSIMTFQGIDGTEVAMNNNIHVTVNNSTYSRAAYSQIGNNSGSIQNGSTMAETLIDVTNTSNVKVKFEYSSVNNGNNILGETIENRTCFIFIRLGDT